MELKAGASILHEQETTCDSFPVRPMRITTSTIRRKFILQLGTLLLVLLTALFGWMYMQARAGIHAGLDRQARTLLQQLVLTRAWVADHGGLFVQQRPGIEPNPFLSGKEVIDQAGKTYLLRNPAVVTRELSQYAEKAGLYHFRLTSLKLRNPANAPQPFEEIALKRFEADGYEASRDGMQNEGIEEGRPVYRRIVPLQVEPSCLECHADQGYQVGAVRGALSVIIPMESALESLRHTRNIFLLGGFGIALLVLAAVYLLLHRMVLTPLGHLHGVAERIIEGQYGAKASLSTGDEFDSLGAAFNNMTGRLKKGYEGTLRALVTAMDTRDRYTQGHTARVARYAVAIARQMEMPDEMIEQVELGAILHDIGKIGISDAILRKCSRLDGEERENMRAHVLEGARIIRHADSLLCALPAILHHHERMDGGGYPEGLQGEELPLMARIIAVADTFDAMTTDRPYRKAMEKGMALDELERHCGSQFDPEVVRAFRAAIETQKT